MAKKKILIIDDEPEFVDIIKMRLEAQGYEVLSANDGQSGLEKAGKERPNLILLDILMPKKDGYTFVRELKKDESLRHIPIIVLTGKPQMKDLFEMEGITDCIAKPFDSQELIDKVSKNI